MVHLRVLTKKSLVASGLARMEVSSGTVPAFPGSLLHCGRVLPVGTKVSSNAMSLALSILIVTRTSIWV